MNRSCTAASTALLCAGLSLAGCSSTEREGGGGAQAASATAMPGIDRTEWTCVELTGADGSPVPVTDRPPTMLIAADGKVSGFAGVNRFFSEATFGNSITKVTPLQFGPVGATRMAGPPERMRLESAFTAMLARVRSAEVMPGDGAGARSGAAVATLVLSGDVGVVARFVAAPDGAAPVP